jgi:serine/threonine protein kinase
VRDGPIALKMIPPQESRERQARFKREILANGFVQHEGIIDVYDAGVTPTGHHYLAMEFFESEDLEQVLQREGSFSLRQAVKVGKQIGRALEAAHHQGIVHRDVKPANILLSQDGNTAKLSDFGLALIRDLGDFKDKVFESDQGGVTGTPEYVSPEQAMRDPVGPASDLYALGLVIYRMLAARLPFAAKTPNGWIQAHMHQPPLPLQQAVPGGSWPPAMLELLERLLVKDPKKRISTAAEVLERLERVIDGLGATKRRIGPFRRGF